MKIRKAEFEKDKIKDDLGTRFTIDDDLITGLAHGVDQTVQSIEQGNSRTGTGCSAGTVTANARLIQDPKTESLKPGDILVAKHTDPGWIAVFSNASAIVVERGSLLSHSAIVAREMGIPCVVALKGAMKWIDDGETISVNGASGEVQKLS